MTAGYEHTCAILADGSVYCWGWNLDGELGVGDTVERHVPTKVQLPDKAVSLASRGAYYPPLDNGYESHTCAALANGAVYCWGGNYEGELGDGTLTPSTSPIAAAVSNARAVTAGSFSSCAITLQDDLYCWGDSTYQPGGLIPAMALSDVSAAASGNLHTCAIQTNGTLWCFGDNTHGQLGLGDNTNRKTATQVTLGMNLSDFVDVAASAFQTCARNSSGLLCWGANGAGQLGLGDTMDRNVPTGVSVSNPVGIGMGDNHSAAVTMGGTSYFWGANLDGELGDGTIAAHTSPTASLVQGAKQLALGERHSCALTEDGLYCWGYNAYGQLGDGTTTSRSSPVRVVWP